LRLPARRRSLAALRAATAASRRRAGRWHGSTVLPAQFEHAGEFHDGLAVVKKDGAYGFIDRSGTLVISAQYKEVSEFADGLAGTRVKDGAWGFIDTQGRMVKTGRVRR
jgi:hypothetical protein